MLNTRIKTVKNINKKTAELKYTQQISSYAVISKVQANNKIEPEDLIKTIILKLSGREILSLETPIVLASTKDPLRPLSVSLDKGNEGSGGRFKKGLN